MAPYRKRDEEPEVIRMSDDREVGLWGAVYAALIVRHGEIFCAQAADRAVRLLRERTRRLEP